jgi:hypothetical protein
MATSETPARSLARAAAPTTTTATTTSTTIGADADRHRSQTSVLLQLFDRLQTPHNLRSGNHESRTWTRLRETDGPLERAVSAVHGALDEWDEQPRAAQPAAADADADADATVVGRGGVDTSGGGGVVVDGVGGVGGGGGEGEDGSDTRVVDSTPTNNTQAGATRNYGLTEQHLQQKSEQARHAACMQVLRRDQLALIKSMKRLKMDVQKQLHRREVRALCVCVCVCVCGVDYHACVYLCLRRRFCVCRAFASVLHVRTSA